MKALIDGDRDRTGRNQYTADSFITDTHKQCSWCDEIKPHASFHKDKKNIRGRGLSYYCKECANAKSRGWHLENKQNPKVKEAKRNSYIKHKHGLSIEEYLEKLERQAYKCRICCVALPPSGFFTHLDHNHKSGVIRDFLCTNCNRGLGHFQDNPNFLKAAMEYLISHTENGTLKEGSCL